MDLTFVATDDLVKEIEKRSTEFICAFVPNGFQTKKELMFYYGKGNWQRSCSLSAILNNDVLNNWNNELKTLQRINEEQQ